LNPGTWNIQHPPAGESDEEVKTPGNETTSLLTENYPLSNLKFPDYKTGLIRIGIYAGKKRITIAESFICYFLYICAGK
jgi:hypothetical protein